MTLEIHEKMRSYTKEQLEAVIETLESFDIDGWRKEIDEYGLCPGPWRVTTLLTRAREHWRRRMVNR